MYQNNEIWSTKSPRLIAKYVMQIEKGEMRIVIYNIKVGDSISSITKHILK